MIRAAQTGGRPGRRPPWLVGAHVFTSEFGRAADAPTRQYLTDRRLEAAARLLVDTEPEVRGIPFPRGRARASGAP